MKNLQEIRDKIRENRQNLAESFQIAAAKKVSSIITSLEIFKESEKIAVYCAIRGELDPHPITEQAWLEQKKCYLPITDFNKGQLIFTKFAKNSLLVKNRYGISEPKLNPEELIQPDEFDLVITPLVAFDSQGNRIGNGGGYYDKAFAFKREHSRPKPILLAVGYKLQQIPNFTPKSWDVKMDMIITEQGIAYENL